MRKFVWSKNQAEHNSKLSLNYFFANKAKRFESKYALRSSVNQTPDTELMSILSESEKRKIIEDVYRARVERPQQIEQMKIRQKQGWSIARQCARVLKQDFGATSVMLFGSMLVLEDIYPDSDIDLAVWGLTAENFWSAWCAVDRVVSESGYNFPPIDLVDVKDAKPYILQAILEEGLEL